MTATILITGFGPFPGAPFNPTEPLVIELARRRHPTSAKVRRVAHVFDVSYESVDRELPVLLEREQPDALIMFGLAGRTRHVRVETRARNVLSRLVPDAKGEIPVTATIAAGAPATMPLRAPVQRLVAAGRAAGVPVAPSHDAGRYLCNYLCWRAAEAARSGAPRVVTFIHVPRLRPAGARSHASTLMLADLTRAGEAMIRAALAAC